MYDEAVIINCNELTAVYKGRVTKSKSAIGSTIRLVSFHTTFFLDYIGLDPIIIYLAQNLQFCFQ